MPCVFCYSKQEVLPFSPDPPVMPAVLADRDAPCHHLVAPGRRTLSLPLRLLRPNHRQKQQFERPYPPANQQPPRQAVARSRRSRTSSTRTSRLRQRGHFMQSTSFLLWICTHYTACTPLLQSLFRHFVLRAFFLFIFWRDIRRHRCADFLRRTPRNRLIHRPRCVLPNHKVVDVCLLQHIPCRWNCRIRRALLLRH